MRIIWDEPKRQANLAKHGLDFAALTLAVFDADIVQRARNGRLKVIGHMDGMAVAVIFAPLGSEAISIISLRAASARERGVL